MLCHFKRLKSFLQAFIFLPNGNYLDMKKIYFGLIFCLFIAFSIFLCGCSKTTLNENEISVRLFYDSNGAHAAAVCDYLFDGVDKLIFSKNGEVSAKEIEGLVNEILTSCGEKVDTSVEKRGQYVDIVVGESSNVKRSEILTLPL